MRQILASHDLRCQTHFWPHHSRIIKVIFSFPEFVSAYEKPAQFIYSFLRCSQFSSPVTRVTTPTSIFCKQLLIFKNLCQYFKNQVISSFCSRDLFNLKILQSDWPRLFWPISQEPDFLQIRVCVGI